MFQILFCQEPGVVRILYLIKVMLNIIRFVLPIGLIFMVSLDLYKNLLNSVSDAKETVIKKSGNRIIACIIVFCIPTLINLLLAFISKLGFNANNPSFAICYTEANSELIKVLEEQKKLKLEEEAEKIRKENALLKAQYEAKIKKQIEENKKNNNQNSNSTYSSNLTDLNKQNTVYVKNGTFYIPKFKKNNPDTYSGKGCPTDPLKQGYNNKYGYNNYFWNMLTNLIEGAKNAGYNLGFSNQGCRSYDTQYKFYYKTYKNQPGRAATPGNSRHGYGIASDLTFYKNANTKCGSNRSYNNCPGMKWVHEHAADYGLKFPLLNASYKEDWHIEPMNLERY